MTEQQQARTAQPWRTELTDVVRAVSGGLLFGVPLMYTMEVWFTGDRTSPAGALVALLLAFVPVLLLNWTSGFRSVRDVRWRDAVIDSVETVAVAIVLVTVVLVVIRQIDGATPLRAGLGRVVYEAIPFAIGIGLASQFLRGGRDDGDRTERRGDERSIDGTLADVLATAIGAVFIALNIAPTDEVAMLSAQTGPPWLLAIVVTSLVASYAIVFVAGFAGQRQRRQQVGVLQHPVTETVVAYVVSLGAAAAMLWFFQRAGGPWDWTLSQIVVLGLPATIGGAAGRLAV